MKGNLLKLFEVEVKQELSNALAKVRPDIETSIAEELEVFHAVVLSGLIGKNQRENGSKSIRDFMIRGNLNGSTLDQIDSILTDPERNKEIQESGLQMLNFVFDEGAGQSLPEMITALAGEAQIPEEQVRSILHTVTPFSMDLVGQVVHFDALQEGQLSDLLAANQELIQERYPQISPLAPFEDPSPDSTQTSDTPSGEKPDDTVSDPIPPAPDLDSATSGILKKEEEHIPPKDDATPERTSPETPASDSKPEERERFLKALWPWVALLILSGGALFFLNKFQYFNTDIPTESPGPYAGTDSSGQSENLDISLPGNIHLRVENGSFIDSLRGLLERNPQLTDTLRYWNSDIDFDNSSTVLTTKASDELSGIVTILQTNPQIEMGIRLIYDTAFIQQEPGIVNERVRNLSNYFSAFGLDQSRYHITNSIQSPQNQISPGSIEDTADQNNNGQQTQDGLLVELLFYQSHQETVDSLNIQ